MVYPTVVVPEQLGDETLHHLARGHLFHFTECDGMDNTTSYLYLKE